jgi:hypothetical protein
MPATNVKRPGRAQLLAMAAVVTTQSLSGCLDSNTSGRSTSDGGEHDTGAGGTGAGGTGFGGTGFGGVYGGSPAPPIFERDGAAAVGADPDDAGATDAGDRDSGR